MENITYEAILNFFKQNDSFENLKTYNETELSSPFIKKVKRFFNKERVTRQAVLGIDIYRYSRVPIPQQNCIPFIFRHLFERTIKTCITKFSYLFQHYTPEILRKRLVPTGDGGFVILCTPLHCLIFAIAFEMNLRSYNTHAVFQKLRHFTDDISLRYAITYDDLFMFENNFYGPAIINNARILNKDRLNRLLYDADVNKWFLSNLGGVESLQMLSLERISQLSEFKDYDPLQMEESFLIPRIETGKSHIRTIISSKIGTWK